MKANACKCCDHPEAAKIDQMLRSGVSAKAICRAMANVFSEPTLRRHKAHMDVSEPVPEISEEVPEDLLGYGLGATIATIARMRYMMSLDPTPRNAEALNALLGRLLDYDKAIKASQSDQDPTLEIRVIQALGPLESTESTSSDL